MKLVRSIAVGLALAFAGNSATAATVDIAPDNQLLGAMGVEVAGTLYDVAFVDGICVDVVFGCDNPASLAFSDAATALLAAQAIFDQVINIAGANYSSSPGLVNGIDLGQADSYIYTPLFNGSGFDVVSTRNHQATVLDAVSGPSSIIQSTDTSAEAITVFASWSLADTEPTVSAVPLPAGGILMLTGLAGIAALGRLKSLRRS